MKQWGRREILWKSGAVGEFLAIPDLNKKATWKWDRRPKSPFPPPIWRYTTRILRIWNNLIAIHYTSHLLQTPSTVWRHFQTSFQEHHPRPTWSRALLRTCSNFKVLQAPLSCPTQKMRLITVHSVHVVVEVCLQKKNLQIQLTNQNRCRIYKMVTAPMII